MSIFAQRTISVDTNSGQIPGGFIFAAFKNLGTQPVTVEGMQYEPGEAWSYPFVGKAYELPVDYDPAGQPLRILIIR